MKKLAGFIIVLFMMVSCSSHQGLRTSRNNQAYSVWLNKKKGRGLKRASIIVNARMSAEAEKK